jgi:hypothetical protein
MEIALGILRWTPDVFRKATPHEVFTGLEGYLNSRGGEGPRLRAKKQASFKKLYEAVLEREQK